MSYTLIAVTAIVVAVLIDLAVTKSRTIKTGAFWFTTSILVFFQLVTNSWLTGRGIVNYDKSQIIGLRIASAPAEDLLFGFSLFLLTITVWVRLGLGRNLKKLDR